MHWCASVLVKTKLRSEHCGLLALCAHLTVRHPPLRAPSRCGACCRAAPALQSTRPDSCAGFRSSTFTSLSVRSRNCTVTTPEDTLDVSVTCPTVSREPKPCAMRTRTPATRPRCSLRALPAGWDCGNGLLAELQLILGATSSPSGSCPRARRRLATSRSNAETQPPPSSASAPVLYHLVLSTFFARARRRVEKRVAGKKSK